MNQTRMDTIQAQVKEILEYIDGGPWHWADWDLILIYYGDDFGFNRRDISLIRKELDKQAYHHELRIGRTTIHVWATRPEIETFTILQEYLNLTYHE